MSESKQERTPGHWSFEPHGQTHALYSGRTADRHGFRLMNFDDGDRNFSANAEFIVRACNSFDAMLAALKDAEMALADPKVAAQKGYGSRAEKSVRAAIALAEDRPNV